MAGSKILVLGSGMVASPCVEYLARKADNSITIGSRTVSKAKELAARFPGVKAIEVDVTNTDTLDQQIADHDVVISLVPFVHHASIIKSAIKSKTHVVTTSYVSPAIKALEADAKSAGIVVLNEVGVDPGFDHCYAIKTIEEVHSKGGKVKEFYSYCGGLPAPECSDNPLRFKFSWSPRGALLSQFNSAQFLKDGRQVEISNQDLMVHAVPYHVKEGYSFVAYPNRNSLPFRESYNIPEAETVIRGSLRYKENPPFMRALIKLGWVDTEEKEWLVQGLTWAQVQQKAIDAKGADESSLTAKIDERCKFSHESEREQILSGLRWIGIFSNEPAPVQGNLLDTLCAQLAKLISFQPSERDLVMLQHKFVVEWSDGRKETLTSTLELFGDPKGYSGMARSVGTTCGIATQLLLDGIPAFSKPGVLAPYTEDICAPLRSHLEREGLTMVEKSI